jgi:hypothetical protein
MEHHGPAAPGARCADSEGALGARSSRRGVGCRHRQLQRAKRGGELTGPNPTDRDKRGTKYDLVVASEGIPFAALPSDAYVHDTMLFPGLVRRALADLTVIPITPLARHARARAAPMPATGTEAIQHPAPGAAGEIDKGRAVWRRPLCLGGRFPLPAVCRYDLRCRRVRPALPIEPRTLRAVQDRRSVQWSRHRSRTRSRRYHAAGSRWHARGSARAQAGRHAVGEVQR